jgi:arabinogalactan oligomer/maltooligosaccharide transport system substrate-binding protein
LSIWIGDAAKDIFAEIAKDFETETGIKVKMTIFTDLSASDKLELDGPAGKGGDVYMQGGGGSLGSALQKGLFAEVPIDKIDKDLYTQTGLDNYMYDGKLFGLPMGVEVPALIYNKKLIQEIPDTWEKLLEECSTMNDFSNRKYGFLMDIGNPYFTNAITDAYGGYIFKAADSGFDVNDIGVNSAESKAAFKRFIGYATVDKLFPKTMKFEAMQQAFKNGKAAVIFDGPWSVMGYKQAGIDLGVAPLPKIEAAGTYPRVYSGAYGLAISAFAKNKEGAIEFIKFATGKKENVMKYYSLTQRIPALKECLELPEVKDEAIQNAFSKQIENSIKQPNVPEMDTTWGPLMEAVQVVINENYDPDKALDSAAQKIKEAIALMKN